MFAFPPLRKQLYDAYGGHHAACSREQIMQQLRRQIRLDEKKRDERPNRLRQTRCSGQHQCISTASCRRINRGGDYDPLRRGGRGRWMSDPVEKIYEEKQHLWNVVNADCSRHDWTDSGERRECDSEAFR